MKKKELISIDDKLTEREELFCLEYVKTLNATKAAVTAGFSEKSARSIASQLLTRVNIEARVQHLFDERANRVRVDGDTILRELLKMATVDVTQAYSDEGWLKPLSEMPEDVRRCINQLEVHELFDGQGDEKHIIGVNKKVRFYDKTKALELLGKHLKLFTEKLEVDADMTMKIIIEDYVSREKASERDPE